MNRNSALWKNLEGKQINGYSLLLGDVKQLRLSGWKGFKLYTQNPRGILDKPQLLQASTVSAAEMGCDHGWIWNFMMSMYFLKMKR